MDGGHDDWKQFISFNPLHYVRHLIDDNEEFELMLICWQPGQGSHVHNHGQSHCWMTLMDGSVEELRFVEDACEEENSNKFVAGNLGGRKSLKTLNPKIIEIPGVLGTTSPCPRLHPAGVTSLALGQTAYINDDIALHAVRCPSDCPAPGAVTLHLYAPPIRKVKLYEPESNRVVLRTPGFYSARGVKT